MKSSRFQTDYGLWFWSALGLFLGSWFFPIIPDKAGGTPIQRALEYGLGTVVGFEVFALAISILVAWFFMCGVALVRASRPETIKPRAVLQFAAAVAISAGLFPPWTYTSKEQIPGASLRDLQCSWGYSFVLAPPTHQFGTFTIDKGQLIGEWVGIALAAGCGLLYFRQERCRAANHSTQRADLEPAGGPG